MALSEGISRRAAEYAERFSELGEVLEWLSLCGFLTVRGVEDGAYYVVFPSEPTKGFMLRFVERSTADLPFEFDIEEGSQGAAHTARAERIAIRVHTRAVACMNASQ